jgi:hypothetical protein
MPLFLSTAGLNCRDVIVLQSTSDAEAPNRLPRSSSICYSRRSNKTAHTSQVLHYALIAILEMWVWTLEPQPEY